MRAFEGMKVWRNTVDEQARNTVGSKNTSSDIASQTQAHVPPPEQTRLGVISEIYY